MRRPGKQVEWSEWRKTIRVVQVHGDGTETTLYPEEHRPMANPTAKRVTRINTTLARLSGATDKLCSSIGHWSPEVKTALEAAYTQLLAAQGYLDALPPGYVAPKKPMVRSHMALKIDDQVKIRERVKKHTPASLVGAVLKIVGFEGELAHVMQVEGDVRYAVKRSALVRAE